MEAVKGLDIEVVIAAGSPWSKRADTTANQEIPDNVLVRRFTQFELRDLYDMSAFMVMPLFDVEFQAGVTALLEAMALEKAIVCSATPGQTDVVVEGETGLYVPPEDAVALREAIVKLLDDPNEATRMGKNGRKRIVDYMSLERYVERLNKYVQA
jgi:glycosyltransferase involved in cell wall biosynthesis